MLWYHHHHHHHHRITSVGHRVARLWWPCPRACLQRSAGVWLVSFQIWSIHLPRGRPGRRLQEGDGRRPSERLTWNCRALCAGVLSCSLAMWPKTAMRRCRMTSSMAARPVSADIFELWTNCLHEILRILRWHFIWNASRDLASAEVRVYVSEA